MDNEQPTPSKMDPYELFSTPPEDIVRSSTPIKPPKQTPLKTTKYAAKKKDPPASAGKINPISKRSNLHPRKQKSENLWDKCIKTNPDLAQFVDKFNQSLAEATSKPLDITTDEK